MNKRLISSCAQCAYLDKGKRHTVRSDAIGRCRISEGDDAFNGPCIFDTTRPIPDWCPLPIGKEID